METQKTRNKRRGKRVQEQSGETAKQEQTWRNKSAGTNVEKQLYRNKHGGIRVQEQTWRNIYAEMEK